jgi:hypothetical protein
LNSRHASALASLVGAPYQNINASFQIAKLFNRLRVDYGRLGGFGRRIFGGFSR